MLKALAVLRTLFLAFIAVYTFRAMPFFLDMARTHDESYARCTEAFSLVSRAAWMAVGWIALETAVGWWMVVRTGREAQLRKMAPAVPRPGTGEPPFAPPR